MKPFNLRLTGDQRLGLQALASVDGNSEADQIREAIAYRLKARAKDVARGKRMSVPLKERKKTNEGRLSRPPQGGRSAPAQDRGKEEADKWVALGHLIPVPSRTEIEAILARRNQQRLELFERHQEEHDGLRELGQAVEGCPWCQDPAASVPSGRDNGQEARDQ